MAYTELFELDPMDIAEQIVVIFSGVRGFLDKVDPTRITEFEEKFLIHMRTTESALVDTIRWVRHYFLLYRLST